MRKITYVILGTFLLLFSSCKEKKEQPIKIEETTKTETLKEENQTINTYAAVWKWATNDVQLMENNTVTIGNELQELYKKGIVENAYYNADSKIDKFEYFPNITFFVKANSNKNAENILDNLTIVKKGIATYTLHQVGLKTFGRNTDTINKNGMTFSFVSVWSTNKTPTDQQRQSQFDLIKNLYETGSIENVYLDVEEVKNTTTDFVLFVNANSEEEAKKILNNFPFVKENIATYKLHSVGVFWMGEYKK